jgi:hypothetical protein
MKKPKVGYKKPVPWTFAPEPNPWTDAEGNPWIAPLDDMEEERKTMERYREALVEAAKKIVPTEPPPDPSPFDIL